MATGDAVSRFLDETDAADEDRTVQVRRAPARRGFIDQVRQAAVTADNFVRGAADAVTFGFADEAAAALGSATGIGGKRGDYAGNLKAQRKRDAEGGAARIVGQVAGSLAVPFGSGVKGAKGLAAVGAAQGAVYGAGSADGDLEDRAEGALEGAAWGAVGGYAIGKAVPLLGRAAAKVVPMRLRVSKGATTAAEKVDLGVTKRTPQAAPKAPSGGLKVDVPAGEAKPLVSEGELLSPSELLGDPNTARALVNERLGKLNDEQMASLSSRLTKAMEDGEAVDDPFFRSLLNIDTTALGGDPQKTLQVLEVFDDALDDMLTRGGAGHRTVDAMVDGFNKLKAKGVTLDDLMANAEQTSDLYAKARIGTHAMTLAGHEFVKAREALLPRIIAKETGARDELAEQLVRSAQIYALGRAPLSNAARAMRFAQEDLSIGMSAVADDVMDLPDPKMIERRVRDALKKLGDEDVAELMGRIKTADDLGRVDELLNDATAAEQFSSWRKARESVSKMLKSNALSPATGLYNAASLVLHDFWRADLSRSKAIRSLVARGDTDAVELLRLERAAGRAVYWEAHKRGMAALVNRVKWEFWTDVERVSSVGWGSGKVTAAARSARAGMAQRGYNPPSLRENPDRSWMSMQKGSSAEFNARLAKQSADGGAFGRILAAVERADTVATNAFEAATTASAKLFIGAFDDWGRAFVRTKEMHVQSTRHAVREGLAAGLEGKELGDFVRTRAKELAEVPNKSIMDAIERAMIEGTELDDETRFLMKREKLIDQEADKVLFMDGPQTGVGKASASFLSKVDPVGVVFPYIRTPIRLFETGLVDYTPAGKYAAHMRELLSKGGPEAELAKARMEMGLTAIGVGLGMGLTGTLVVTNGGFENTGNLDAGPPNRIQIGDSFMEVGRLDPFSLTLALGGFIGQAIKEGVTTGSEFDAEEGIRAALATALAGVQDAVLSKSYLTGLRDAVQTITSTDEGKSTAGVQKVAMQVLARAVPLAGTQKQVNETVRGTTPEVVDATDQVLRNVLGSGMFLPVRRDILGDAIDSKVAGVAVGLSTPADDVKRQLRDLHIDVQAIRKADPEGFGLSAKQLDELRRIRGTEATDPEGRTLREALAELFADEEFQQAGTRAAKQKLVTRTVSAFNSSARELLAERDPQYAADRNAYGALADYIEKDLMSREDAREAARADTLDAGLVEPNL